MRSHGKVRPRKAHGLRTNPTRNQIKAASFPWLGAGLTAGGLVLLLLAGGLFIGSSLKRRR